MFQTPTYYYHIISSAEGIEEWIRQNGGRQRNKQTTTTAATTEPAGQPEQQLPAAEQPRIHRHNTVGNEHGGDPTTTNADYTNESSSQEDQQSLQLWSPTITYDCVETIIRHYETTREGNNWQIYDGNNDGYMQRKSRTSRHINGKSPWKFACLHEGGACSKRKHWHLLYISRNKQWGHNSNFGRLVRTNQHRCEGITCLACLVEYLYSGNGRTVFKDDIRRSDYENCKCAFHGMAGIGGRRWPRGNSENTEGRIRTSEMEGIQQGMGQRGMVQTNDETNDVLFANGRRGMEHEQAHINPGEEQAPGTRRHRLDTRRNTTGDHLSNAELVLLFCEERAFNEGEGERILSKTPEGIEYLFKQRAQDRIKTAITVARILVFQETLKQRIERCKKYQLKQDPDCIQPSEVDAKLKILCEILNNNDIDQVDFARKTFGHLCRQTGKRNNLFFMGPPSTGKTMIMESLAALHYNYARLTGLTPQSSFNFASLLNVNACFMDECKLTDNQFEQWKLLAAGSPMATDIKYKERHNVENCVLYTCANHTIGQYVQVSDAHKAIDTRTIQFNFLRPLEDYTIFSVFVWEKLWKSYGMTI